MKSIILNSISTLLFASAFLLFNSCGKDSGDFTLPEIPEVQKKVEFDKHSIEVVGNAQVSIVDGEVQIENLGKDNEPFSFYVRPLTDDYWINILFNDLKLATGQEVSTSRFIKNQETGETSMLAKTTFNDKGMIFGGEMQGQSANLLVANQKGGWEDPWIDIEVDTVQTIWPWIIGGVIAVISELDFSYKSVTTYDADGNPTGSTVTKEASFGLSQPLTGRDGLVLGDPEQMNYYELIQTELTPNIAPRTIDGMEVTCTGYPLIRIGKILNGRAPL